MVGAILARAEAHVLRLSLLYALLDRSARVRPEHLRSALALWAFVEQSVIHIFDDASGDPVEDTIRRALRQHGELTRTQIRDLFGRHERDDRVDAALSRLATPAMC